MSLAVTGPTRSASSPPAILVPVYFYQGHTVGKESLPTGLQASRDGGETFLTMTWPEQITNSVAVGPEGRWVWLAEGNGVMVSRDGGRSWRLTGGWRMTEVQRVIPTGSPGEAYAATAYGVFFTEDAGASWRKVPHEGVFRYATDLLSERTSAVGYLLKDRVAHVTAFLDALRRVAAGGTALDPEVVAQLLVRHRTDPARRTASVRLRSIQAA